MFLATNLLLITYTNF